MAVAVDAATAQSELDLPVGGERFKRLSRVVDERPGIVSPPAERRHRRLGADQAHGPALGQLQGLAVDDAGDSAGLGCGQVAGAHRRTPRGKPSRAGKGKNIGHPPDHPAS